jgi:hypothetical protein
MAVKRLFRVKVQAGVKDHMVYITDSAIVVENWDHTASEFGPMVSTNHITLTAAVEASNHEFRNLYGVSEYRSALAAKIDELEQETFEPGADVATLQITIDRLIDVYNS